MGRLIIITGAYGSGKTESALALSLQLAREGTVTLVDLDFVTPYFRSQDLRAELEHNGVRVIAPEERVAAIDAPSLPPTVAEALTHPHGTTIVDLGGDPAGAVVMGQFAPRLSAYEMWGVINFFRPTTATPEDAAGVLREISAVTRLRLTGLVSNSNLGGETTAADVRYGLEHTRALGRLLALPVVMVCAPAGVAVPALDLPILVITPRLHRPWEHC